MEILQEYQRILREEAQFIRGDLTRYSFYEFLATHYGNEMHDLCWRLLEIAKSAFVQRSFVARYGLPNLGRTNESVSAHTNLLSAMVDAALAYQYGPKCDEKKTSDGYSYRQIMEVVRLHDLPEVEFGDMPDNGSRDEEKKQANEMEYLRKFTAYYPSKEGDFVTNVERLILDMQQQSSETGRMLYLADKVAAVLITLAYDSVGKPPMLHGCDKTASKRDKDEMEMCDWSKMGFHKASEMWTMDLLSMRRITVRFDATGFFTAIIVMMTLMVNDSWYQWREKEYELLHESIERQKDI
ncbi:MAG: HD domain-containing protein [Candidatus Saccharibacteria bacterium]|nr:HD domain-containing protein [Candidatus Saccharibacteria bacterium]